jgi:hypothetical protein
LTSCSFPKSGAKGAPRFGSDNLSDTDCHHNTCSLICSLEGSEHNVTLCFPSGIAANVKLTCIQEAFIFCA